MVVKYPLIYIVRYKSVWMNERMTDTFNEVWMNKGMSEWMKEWLEKHERTSEWINE